MYGAPIRFIYETLIKAFPGDPTAEGNTPLMNITAVAGIVPGTAQFTRSDGGSFLADGFKNLVGTPGPDNLPMRFQAFGFGAVDGWYTVFSVATDGSAITVLEPILAGAVATGDEWLSTSVSRGLIQDPFFEMRDILSLQVAALNLAAGGPPSDTFDNLVDDLVADHRRRRHARRRRCSTTCTGPT